LPFPGHRFLFFFSLYPPKTAIAALANLQSEDLTLEKAFPRGKSFSSPKLEPQAL
jgi:hypothetical protein